MIDFQPRYTLLELWHVALSYEILNIPKSENKIILNTL